MKIESYIEYWQSIHLVYTICIDWIWSIVLKNNFADMNVEHWTCKHLSCFDIIEVYFMCCHTLSDFSHSPFEWCIFIMSCSKFCTKFAISVAFVCPFSNNSFPCCVHSCHVRHLWLVSFQQITTDKCKAFWYIFDTSYVWNDFYSSSCFRKRFKLSTIFYVNTAAHISASHLKWKWHAH